MNNQFEVGEIVTGIYKTGKYIGEITMIKPEHYLVRVIGVLKHPQQGDLHNPKMVDVPLFHERRALAYREQVNVPKVYIKKFEGTVPSYEESLSGALNEQIKALENDDSEWGKKSIELLQSLKKDYFKE